MDKASAISLWHSPRYKTKSYTPAWGTRNSRGEHRHSAWGTPVRRGELRVGNCRCAPRGAAAHDERPELGLEVRRPRESRWRNASPSEVRSPPPAAKPRSDGPQAGPSIGSAGWCRFSRDVRPLASHRWPDLAREGASRPPSLTSAVVLARSLTTTGPTFPARHRYRRLPLSG